MRLARILKLLTVPLLASVFSGSSSFGQEAFHLEDTSHSYRLDSHIQVFVDSTSKMTIDEVADPSGQDRFYPSNGDLTFGYMKPPIWLKLDYLSTLPDANWYLEIPAPFLEYVDFYQLREDSTWYHTSSGYFRKHSERDLSHTAHVVPLLAVKDAVRTIYVRIGGVSPKTFRVHAVEEKKFLQKTRWEDLGYGIFFGALILMFIYNVYIYLTIRQTNYLLYFCIIGCTILIFSAISGYGGKFIWPEKPVFNFINGKLALEVLIVFLTVYVINFLDVKRYSRVLYYLLWSLVPLSFVALFLSTTHILTSAGNNLISLATMIFMAAGVIVWVKGNRAGAYFLAAWTFYFLGGLFLTLRNSGLLDYGFWTTHFVEVGAVLGTSMIGFGLGAQYRNLQREKEEVQLLAFKFQQEATARLETKVKERTEQLDRANKELQRTLEKNRRQTQIIESKNAELDTLFYRITHDLKGPVLSSLGLTALAKIDVKDPLALEYIDKQHAKLEHLSQLIGRLVSLAKSNNGDIARDRIDFERMIDDCIMSFNTARNFSRIRFEKIIQPDVEYYSEWTLVNAILQNLIENSIKYSRAASPFVRIMVTSDADCIVIQVEDNGQGISPEDQEKIFDMFYRVSNDAEGTGLGLYILKQSVDRLQGKIEISSELGRGSTFVVRLPRRSNITGEVTAASAES